MAATVLFWGIDSCKGGGNLCRNLGRIVGLPRGANEGLDGVEDGSSSWLGILCGSSPPSPVVQVNKLNDTCDLQASVYLLNRRREANPRRPRTPWNAEGYLQRQPAMPIWNCSVDTVQVTAVEMLEQQDQRG
jgi:hypothetical protein